MAIPGKIYIDHDIAKDNILIRQDESAIEIPRHMVDGYQNSLYRMGNHWRAGIANPYQNAIVQRKTFPRSEQTQDGVMIRRVNLRNKYANEKRQRHVIHAVVGAAVVVFAPLVIVGILRMWGMALAWLAS